MRIISGQARGRKLFTPGQSKEIRPTSDRSREALFNIIGQKIVGARVLDLYSGTGAFGLEALSRGAKDVVFVDLHQKAIELTRRNLEMCMPSIDFTEAVIPRIVKYDLRRGIPVLPVSDTTQQTQFDFIFLDPPYGRGLAEKTLQDIDTSQLCTENALIIAEEVSTAVLPDSFPTQLTLSDQRRYGVTKFWFYTTQNRGKCCTAAS